MNKEQFEHQGGQWFKKYLEFTTLIAGTDKKIILVQSVYNLSDSKKLIDSLEPHYYSKNHWFVLYGDMYDKEFDMGVTRLAYPIATRALTLSSALPRFHQMVKDINYINFIKLS